jgi:hypothetical protein
MMAVLFEEARRGIPLVPGVINAARMAAVMVTGNEEMGRGADDRHEDLEPQRQGRDEGSGAPSATLGF